MSPNRPQTGFLSQLVPLNRSVYEYASHVGNNRGSDQRRRASPDLIILLGWGGASLRSVARYAESYADEFSQTPLLLVLTEFADLIWNHAASQDLVLRPVVARLEDITAESRRVSSTISQELGGQENEKARALTTGHSKRPRILVHAFSNGGCWALIEISKRYRKNRDGSGVIPIDTLIIDSAPGNPSNSSSAAAITEGILPGNQLLRLPSNLIISGGLNAVEAVMGLLGKENPIVAMVRLLNEPALVDVASKRCYIYSDQDAIVASTAVQRHAAAAREAGFAYVHEEPFNGSSHVSHAKFDPKRYWSIVMSQWDRDVASLNQVSAAAAASNITAPSERKDTVATPPPVKTPTKSRL